MSQPTPKLSRRTLFAGAGTVGALAAAASVVPAARQAEPSPADSQPEPPARGGGYHLSERVKRYYQTTKL